MPGNLSIALFVVGAILLLIALLGGQFKLFGAEVSGTVGRASRWMSGLAALILIGAAVLLESTGTKPAQPSPGAAPAPAVTPSAPRPTPAPPPESARRAADPDALFIDLAVWPQSADSRVRDAVRLALHGEDIARARRLMAEAGQADGLTVVLPMQRFAAAGGTDDDVRQIERKLARIGVRVELRR